VATTTTNNGWTIPQSTDLVTNGATAIATLGYYIDTSVGSGFKAWVAYTPTVTNVTKGTGPTESYTYCQLGKTVIVRLKLTLGTSGAVTGVPTFTLPVTASATANDSKVRNGFCQLNDSGTSIYYGDCGLASTTTVTPQVYNAASTYLTASPISATVPFTFAVGDAITMQFTYEAA
jgi:hypothetical protein